jgi:hypothetical protein
MQHNEANHKLSSRMCLANQIFKKPVVIECFGSKVFLHMCQFLFLSESDSQLLDALVMVSNVVQLSNCSMLFVMVSIVVQLSNCSMLCVMVSIVVQLSIVQCSLLWCQL